MPSASTDFRLLQRNSDVNNSDVRMQWGFLGWFVTVVGALAIPFVWLLRNPAVVVIGRITKQLEFTELLEVQKVVLQIGVGLFGLLTLFFGMFRLMVQHRESEMKNKEIRNTREDQIHDRFIRGIELISGKGDGAAYGAIAVLGLLAEENSKMRFAVQPVLAALVRQVGARAMHRVQPDAKMENNGPEAEKSGGGDSDNRNPQSPPALDPIPFEALLRLADLRRRASPPQCTSASRLGSLLRLAGLRRRVSDDVPETAQHFENPVIDLSGSVIKDRAMQNRD